MLDDLQTSLVSRIKPCSVAVPFEPSLSCMMQEASKRRYAESQLEEAMSQLDMANRNNERLQVGPDSAQAANVLKPLHLLHSSGTIMP